MLNLGMRSTEKEFMDAPEFQGPGLISSFSFIRLINRLGGGQRAVLNGLAAALRGRPKNHPVEILDVGCGVGDLGKGIIRWGGKHGFDLRYTGMDQSEHTLHLARQQSEGGNLRFVRGDLFDEHVPQADIIIASMVFHHFDDQLVAKAIDHLSARSRWALIINDLERSVPSYLICSFLTFFYRNPAVRNDALLSIRKGFTLEEIKTMLNASSDDWRARRAIGWRLLGVVHSHKKTSGRILREHAV